MTEQKIRQARFTLILSIMIALAVNLVATFYAQLLVSIPVLAVTFILTIYVLAHYSDVVTSKERQIRTVLVFDGKTGDLTNYPENFTQTMVRQTLLHPKHSYFQWLAIFNGSTSAVVVKI